MAPLGGFFEEGKDLINEDLLKGIQPCSYVNLEGMIFSKTGKTAITIPRLELQAAVLVAQVDAMLREQLDLQLSKSHFWVDSEIVVKYIKNEYSPFRL